MPTNKSTNKRYSKNQRKLTPGRLIKSNGKFSTGKLAIVALSFAAIAVIVMQSAFASSWDVKYYWNSPGIQHQNGSNTIVYVGTKAVSVWQSAADSNNSGYMWYGPYDSIYVPQPSGMKYALCLDGGGGTATYPAKFVLDMAQNGGQIMASWTGYFTGFPQSVCGYITLAQGVFSKVEYRVRFTGGAPLYIIDTHIIKLD